MSTNLVTIIAILLGVFSIVASILNWDFYFEHRKARSFVKLFGRNGARVFYVLLGIFIIVIGVMAQVNN